MVLQSRTIFGELNLEKSADESADKSSKKSPDKSPDLLAEKKTYNEM